MDLRLQVSYYSRPILAIAQQHENKPRILRLHKKGREINECNQSINPFERTYLRERLVAVVLANLGTGILNVFIEFSPERSSEWCPGLDQYPSLGVFGNHVAGVIRYAVRELIDDRFDGGLFQHAIELLRGKVRNRYAFGQLLSVHFLKGTPLASNGIAI